MAVRAAASLCVHLARRGGCALLLPGERRPLEVGARPGRVARRARAPRAGRGAARRPPLGARAARRRGDLGHARRCATRRARSSALPPAARSWSPDAAARQARPAFTVAGCTGVPGRAARRRSGRVSAAPSARRRRLPRGSCARRAPRPARGDSRPLRLAAFAALAAFGAGALGRRSSSRPPVARIVLRAGGRRRAPARADRLLGRARAAAPGAVRARRAGRAWSALAARLCGDGPARAAAAPGALGRARRRARPRPRRHPDRRLALRGPDEWVRLDDPARAPRSCWRSPRRSRSGRRAAGAPLLRLAGLVALLVALRHRGDRARPRRPAAARPRAAPARGGLALAAAPARARGGRRRPRWSWRSACSRCRWPPRSTPSGAWWTTAPGTGSARQARDLRLDPLLRAARLAARGHHAAQRRSRTGPHYWKAETLDGFDGFRWLRSSRQRHGGARRGASATRARHRRGRGVGLLRVQPALGRAHRVHGALAVEATSWWAPASRYDVDGASATTSADGTAQADARSRSSGATPTSSAPTCPTRARADARGARGLPGQLRPVHRARAARPRRERDRGQRPAQRPGARAPGPEPCSSCRPAAGRAGLGRTARRPTPLLRSSEYARMYRLARRLTADAPTTYDAVKAVERHLQENYRYSERPPTRPLPAGRLPVRGQARLLPAVLRSDGADAADGGHPRPRGVRLLAGLAQPRHGRVPRARPRRPLLGRGVLHGDRLGPVRPDAGRLAGRVAVERGRRRAPPPRTRARSTPAPRGRRGRRADASPTAEHRRRPAGLGRARPACCCCSAALAGAGFWVSAASRGCTRSGRPSAPRRSSPSCGARCRGSAGRCPPRTTLLELERRLGRSAGPASAGLRGRPARRALRPARSGGTAPHGAARRAPRADARQRRRPPARPASRCRPAARARNSRSPRAGL